MRHARTAVLWLSALGVAGPALAQEAAKPAPLSPVTVAPGDLRWEATPDGRRIAIVYGDPTKPGPFVMRIRFPARYEIRRHWHPEAEYVTVLAGAIRIALGDKPDRATALVYGVGSFLAIPPRVHITGWTDGAEAVIQVHGMGPFQTVYVEEEHPAR